MTLKKLANNSLVQLICVIILASCFHHTMPIETIRGFLTISTCLRELLVFVLPFLLFSFVAVALSAIPKGSMLFVLKLMTVVFISNFINIMISGSVGFFLLHDAHTHTIAQNTLEITPFFTTGVSPLTQTTHALIAGVLLGFYNSYRPNHNINKAIKAIHYVVMIFMKKFFIPCLPIFVGGFLLKLLAEGKMTSFVSDNYCLCLMMCGFLVLYLMLWCLVAASFNTARLIAIVKNIFPAALTAFSTMSSAAALPFSLEAAEQNTKDKVLSNAVMPLTLNFHMVGDTILIPMMAMVIMLAFHHPLPDPQSFMLFGAFFILNKFAGAGIPSGTIMVTLPVLQQYFQFDDAMLAFTLAFYGVIDPIATSGNVIANNIFVIFFQKMRDFFQSRKAV